LEKGLAGTTDPPAAATDLPHFPAAATDVPPQAATDVPSQADTPRPICRTAVALPRPHRSGARRMQKSP